MNIEPLIEAVINCFVFLSLADENQVEPRAAAQQVECIGDVVQRLDADAQREFARIAQKLADAEESERGHPTTRSDFIRSLPQVLRLDQ